MLPNALRAMRKFRAWEEVCVPKTEVKKRLAASWLDFSRSSFGTGGRGFG